MAAIGLLNTLVATDEIGVSRNGGVDEGYVTTASLLSFIGTNVTVDASSVTFDNTASGLAGTDAQAVLDELDAAVDALQAVSHVAVTAGSSDSTLTVVASGTDSQTLDFKLDPANSFSAFATFATANPTDPAVVAFCQTMAALLISTEAGNSIRLGADNKLYENDANP